MRRLDGGDRERHLRAGGRRNLRPRAVLGQPRRALGPGPVRPRSKAERPRCRVGAPQGAGRDASRPGPGDPGSPGSHALAGRSRVTWIKRLVARRPPRLRGKRKDRNAGDPLAQSRKQGPILFDSSNNHDVIPAEREAREPGSSKHQHQWLTAAPELDGRSLLGPRFRGDDKQKGLCTAYAAS